MKHNLYHVGVLEGWRARREVSTVDDRQGPEAVTPGSAAGCRLQPRSQATSCYHPFLVVIWPGWSTRTGDGSASFSSPARQLYGLMGFPGTDSDTRCHLCCSRLPVHDLMRLHLVSSQLGCALVALVVRAGLSEPSLTQNSSFSVRFSHQIGIHESGTFRFPWFFVSWMAVPSRHHPLLSYLHNLEAPIPTPPVLTVPSPLLFPTALALLLS